jgi:hypothetical protein
MNGLELLTAELVAIEQWDSDYRQTEVHDSIEDMAYLARQKRRVIILEGLSHI